MAGRKPRVPRDEQRGVSPLRGVPAGEDRGEDPGEADDAGEGGGKRSTGARGKSQGPGRGGPARGYSWPPFQEGNTAAVKHGAHSESVVQPRARAILLAVLEDPAMPDHVRTAAFASAAGAWARAEAVAELLFEHMGAMSVEAMIAPPMPGTRAPIDVWRAADAHASRLRSKLGLDPGSYARIARDLGIADRALDAGLDRMSRTGAQLVTRHAEAIGPGDS